MTVKYAFDLKIEDRIIDRHTGEVVIIERLDRDEETDKITVIAYTEEHGDPWDKILEADSQIKVV
jgi:hypothetical protein